MENILVTGGAGFIGSHLCEALLKDDYTVYVIDNMSPYYSVELKQSNLNRLKSVATGRLTFIEADICDKERMESFFTDHSIDVVVHLAACAGVRPSIEDPLLYVDVNIQGTANILECMKKSGVAKMVFASSSSVYGDSSGGPLHESANVDKPISPYAATKKACELICHTYHHLYDMNIACLRFFTVYGPCQRPDLAIHKFTKLLYANKPLPFYGDGSMSRDYTYISDTVGGVLKALDWVCSSQKRFDIFNLGENHTISLSQMVETLEECSGRKAILNRLPQQPGDVNTTFADITKAKEVLGYNPGVDFKTGITKFIQWFEDDLHR
ncbi:MAG: SDR family NAD(P)-dependent oxidoreductase [Deferribacteraceae bacterium]|jgi:UDP-glucuronate 4-epimerase|nr:SDR family NAD(P)-dependent oxidoreductase [Deferribacteraceae bacterium]